MLDIKLTNEQKKFLLGTAYLVWWQKPKEVLQDIPFLLRQIMTLGDLEQTKMLEKLFSKNYLYESLCDAPAGQMTPRAWHFWHYRLTHCRLGEVPPMPKRFIPK